MGTRAVDLRPAPESWRSPLGETHGTAAETRFTLAGNLAQFPFPNGKGGNQDRSLSAAAVRLASLITIIKDADYESSQTFAFTSDIPGHTSFNLIDDGTGANDSLTMQIVPGRMARSSGTGRSFRRCP